MEWANARRTTPSIDSRQGIPEERKVAKGPGRKGNPGDLSLRLCASGLCASAPLRLCASAIFPVLPYRTRALTRVRESRRNAESQRKPGRKGNSRRGIPEERNLSCRGAAPETMKPIWTRPDCLAQRSEEGTNAETQRRGGRRGDLLSLRSLRLCASAFSPPPQAEFRGKGAEETKTEGGIRSPRSHSRPGRRKNARAQRGKDTKKERYYADPSASLRLCVRPLIPASRRARPARCRGCSRSSSRPDRGYPAAAAGSRRRAGSRGACPAARRPPAGAAA